jgi:hypothetical protein
VNRSSFVHSIAINLAVVAVLVAATAFLTPILATPSSPLSTGDEQSVVAWLDAALFDQTMRSALDRHSAMPGQNTYLNGGIPVGAHPSDGSLSPLSLALHNLGAMQAVRVKTFLAIFAGVAALFALARRAGAGRIPSLTAALILPASGFVQQRVLSSPLDLQVLFAMMCLLVVCYAPCTLAYCVTASVLFALGAMQSGSLIFFVPIALVLAALVRCWRRGTERKETAGSLGLILMFGLLFSTIKWLPAVELLGGHNLRRAAQGFVSQSPVGLLSRIEGLISLLTPAAAGWFIIPLLLLAAVGSHAEGRRGRLSLLGLVFIFTSIIPEASLDDGGKAAAWMAIKPLSNTQSVAPVFLLTVMGALCALSFEKALRWKKPVGYALMSAFVLALCVGHFSRENIERAEMPEAVDMSQYQSSPEEIPGHYSVQLNKSRKSKPALNHHPTLFVAQQIGVTNALKQYTVKTKVSPKVKIRSQSNRTWRYRRYKGEVHVAHNRGEILDYQDNGNRIEIKVRTFKKKADLIVNRNFDSGWSAKGYKPAVLKGLLGIHLPEPGDYDISLRYRPVKAFYGAAISGAALFFALIFLIAEWISTRRQAVKYD